MKILTHLGAETQNVWQWFDEETPPPAWRSAAYPLVYWGDAIETLPHLPQLAARVGVWVHTSDDIHDVVSALGDVNRVALIAVKIAKFTDGRAASAATILRRRYQFAGELRAVGDVLADQLVQLSRCGFDSFALRDDRADAQAFEVARRALNALTKHYQPNVVHHAETVSFA
jgi:uncharacterized protein (DUF934 family)